MENKDLLSLVICIVFLITFVLLMWLFSKIAELSSNSSEKKHLIKSTKLYNIWCHICLKVTKHKEGKCTNCQY